MKIFKQKQYTLQEGHYTGPKDMEETPSAIKVIGGSALAGLVIGAAADKALEDNRKPVLGGDQPSSWKTRGAEAGIATGVIAKIVLNTMHNPMDNIKFQELDKCIRKEFGMYRAGGVTIGDSLENRNKMKERFVINSKDYTNFKIIVSISKGKLTLYTLGLTDKQIEDFNDSIDYYCKKYFGMKYEATQLKTKGSWMVTIIFTNHQVAANFLIEISQILGVKINIINNDISEEDLKLFSDVPALDKNELRNIFTRGLMKIIINGGFSNKIGCSKVILESIIDGVNKLRTPDRASLGLLNKKSSYGNKFLEQTLHKIGTNNLVTFGDNNNIVNIYLLEGTFFVSASHGNKEEKLIEKISNLTKIKNTNNSMASLWIYKMKSQAELEIILRKLLSLKIKLNVYIP